MSDYELYLTSVYANMDQDKPTPKAPMILIVLFIALTISFILLVMVIFVEAFQEIFRPAFLGTMISYALLGLALSIGAYKSKLPSKLRNAFLLTGASAFGFALFSVLHNAFYALAELTSNIGVLNLISQALEIVFFLASLTVCPIGYIVGSVKTVLLLAKKYLRKSS